MKPCGRFAPTPSGPLHLGSLLTAVASYLDIRSRGGVWRLRIDDLDPARCSPEQTGTICRQLKAHGLVWDGSVDYQSMHHEAYAAALAKLIADDATYACDCTRARLREESPLGPHGPIYSGRCRTRRLSGTGLAIRLRMPDRDVAIDDRLRGRIRWPLASAVGDFVLRRADGVIGYQLASVVDEHRLEITDVIRGADLIESSLRQQVLHERLYGTGPRFLHLPLLIDARGQKLSKQNHAEAIPVADPAPRLRTVLGLLGQAVDPLEGLDVRALLTAAAHHWNPVAIPSSLSPLPPVSG